MMTVVACNNPAHSKCISIHCVKCKERVCSHRDCQSTHRQRHVQDNSLENTCDRLKKLKVIYTSNVNNKIDAMPEYEGTIVREVNIPLKNDFLDKFMEKRAVRKTQKMMESLKIK